MIGSFRKFIALIRRGIGALGLLWGLYRPTVTVLLKVIILLSYWHNPEVRTQGRLLNTTDMRTTQTNRDGEMQIMQAHNLPCEAFEPQKQQQQ